jgi:hypothetical protein
VSAKLASAVLLAVVCVCASCGGSGRKISSLTALHDLQRAGFTELQIFRNTQADNRDGEIDTIGQPDVAMTFLPPVQLIDYASDESAIRGYGERPGRAYVRWRYHTVVQAGQGIVPRNFVYSPKKAYSARICNVILWSYNIDNDPRLRERLDSATSRLRESCG